MAEAKRPRGAPRKDQTQIPSKGSLDPDVHAAWKASGKTLNELTRAGLVSLGAL